MSARNMFARRAQVAKLFAPNGKIEGARPKNKYGSKKVHSYDEHGRPIVIHSIREAKRWSQLQLMQKAGQITQLERQIVFTFGEPAWRYMESNRVFKFILDFRYINAEGELVHEDAKGVQTTDYKIKKMLMWNVHGIEVLEV